MIDEKSAEAMRAAYFAALMESVKGRKGRNGEKQCAPY